MFRPSGFMISIVSPTEKLIPLLDPVQAVLFAADDPKISIFLYIGIAVINLAFIPRLSKIKARGELAVGTVGYLIQIPGHVLLVELRISKVIVDGLPISPGHRGHIEGRLPCGLQS